MNKFLIFLLTLLAFPAWIQTYSLYEKIYKKQEKSSIELYFHKEKGTDSAIESIKSSENKIDIQTENITKKVETTKTSQKITPEVFLYQEWKDKDFLIYWSIWKWRVDKIEILTCKSSFSHLYDEKWYTLSEFKPGQNEFKFKASESFNNLCTIPYKFKFKYWNETMWIEYEIFMPIPYDISKNKIDEVLSKYSIVLEANTDMNINESTAFISEFSPSVCKKLVAKSTTHYWQNEICEWTNWTYMQITNLWEKLYLLTLKENQMWGKLIFRRLYDLNKNKEVANLDKEIYVTDWNNLEDFRYKIHPHRLVTNTFIYNLTTWEKSPIYREFNDDITHFYSTSDWIKITDINSNKTYSILWIPKTEFNGHFTSKDWYFALLTGEDGKYYSESLNLYYGRLNDNKVTTKKITLGNLPLGCGKAIWTYTKIDGNILTTKWDCNVWVDAIEFNLDTEKLISKEKHKF